MYESRSPAVVTEHIGPSLRITLNRPERENALNYEMISALTSLAEEAAADRELRVVVLEGAGSSFCAGDDPDDMGAWPAEYNQRRPGGSHGPAPLPEQAMLRALRALPKPTVAVLKGRTLGLGFDLACVCDFRLAAADSEIGDTRILQARHAATGVTHVLPRLIGQSQASRLLLLGETVDGREARRIGFVHEQHPPDQLPEAVEQLVGRLATMATRSYAVIKQQVLDELDMPYETALMHSMAIRQTNVIEDRAEGGRAFREKRDARFTGR